MTHYEVLGLHPGVSHELIAQAYQQRREQFETARSTGTDPATVDSWLASLDEAYGVLADPQRRAQYDAALRGPAADVQPAPGGPETAGRRGCAGLALRLGVGALLMLAVGFWATQRDQEASRGPERDEAGAVTEAQRIEVTQLRKGDCFQDERAAALEEGESVDVHRVEVVPCDEAHDNEVIHAYPVSYTDPPWLPTDNTEYPDEEEIITRAREICLPAFAEYVGVEYAESELGMSYIYPDRRGFLSGRRGLLCVVSGPSGRLTGSVAGSEQ